MQQIMIGNKENYFSTLMNEDLKKINYSFPLSCDIDDDNKMLRKQYYEKKIEMLLKMSATVEGEKQLDPNLKYYMEISSNTVKFIYDARTNSA